MAISITVDELEKVASLLIQKLKDDEIKNISIETDCYWLVTSPEWDDFKAVPSAGVGSLVDDWAELQKVLKGLQITTYLDLERFASILRAVSESIAPTPEDDEVADQDQ